MRLSNQARLVATVLLLLGANSSAETLSLTLTDDSYIHGLRPNLENGDRDDIFVTSYGPKQGLVRFDAGALAGLEVNNATLALYLNDIERAGTVSIHAITSSWNESTVNWNNQPPAEAVATAAVNLDLADEGSIVSVDVTEVVARWASGELADGGFLIVTTDNIKAYFDAKEKTGAIAATLEVDSGPPPFSGEAIVLDLANPDNCIIDEPGFYVLDRTWLLAPGGVDGEPNASCGPVHIASGGVTLDLRGFAIFTGYEWGSYEPVLWIDTEQSVTLRNGKLGGIFVAIEASIASDRNVVTLDRIHTGGGVLLGNRRVRVTGGSFSASNEAPLQTGAGRPEFAEGSRVENAALECYDAECLTALGSTLIRDCTFTVNTIGAPAIALYGDDSTVEGNVLDSWVYISGDRNVIAGNYSSGGDTYIEVNGTGNVLDGNIGPGIVFNAAGNFYGDNRVASPGSITGTDGNVDWGGNVTF